MQRCVWLVIAGAMLFAACGTADASGPPDIEVGRDLCSECGMIITDARFASSYRLPDGSEKKFDDVGGMVLHLRDSGDSPATGAMWVADFETGDWIGAADAHFVPTAWVPSPMGHSILAFGDMDRAMAFAGDVDAEVINWDELLTLPEHDGLLGHHHENHTGDDDMDHDDMDHDG